MCETPQPWRPADGAAPKESYRRRRASCDRDHTVTGPAVTGPAVTGPAVTGPAVTGPAVTGPAVLVTGAGGQLGSDVLGVAAGWCEVLGVTRAELDIADADQTDQVVGGWAAHRTGSARLVVVNTAAYTAVDAAETDRDRAYAVNATGPANLARSCARHGAWLVQVSTDYVFAGDASTPYEVTAPTAPAGVYGETKLAGERAVRELCPRSWVVRTAWVYGATGGNFVKTMARLERERETVDVVDDQRGSPTWSAELARGLLALAASDAAAGIYHCTSAGETTWYGLARAVFAELGADPDRVRPTTSDRSPRPAPRPAYSVLSGAAWRDAGLPMLPGWRDGLRTAFRTVGEALRAG
ncbi:MAG: dTDP-4-dehydrorhamnose reductase [Actinobacteria bacterium]|nr:dTDP-4-dehydrorhamnose reductase [Actinomycetota bacterium]MBI3687867.1 dTDP-4-dehydrorhamnose reductase [Actinomycetota bacterium]